MRSIAAILLLALSFGDRVAAQPDTLVFATKGGTMRLSLGKADGSLTWTLADWEKRFGKADRVHRQRRHKTVCSPGFCGTKVQVHRGWFHYYDRMGIELVSSDNKAINGLIIQLDSTGHADAPTGFFSGTVVINGEPVDDNALDNVKVVRPRVSADVLNMDPLGCGEECNVLSMRMRPRPTSEKREYQLTADLPQGGMAVTFDDTRSIRRLRIVHGPAPHRHFEPPRRQGPTF